MKGKGIFLAISAVLGILSSLLNFVSFILVFFVYLSLLYRYKNFSNPQILLIACIFFLYSTVGIVSTTKNKTVLTGTERQISVLFHQWEINGDSLQIKGVDEATNEELLIRYRIKSKQEKNLLHSRLQNGIICQIPGKLEPPQNSRNPNSYNYQHYLSSKQIYWIFVADKLPIQTCSGQKPSFLSLMEEIRTKGMDYVATHFPEPSASLGIALLFGDQGVMDDDLVTSYQKIGIIHLLAISGLQVTFLTGVIFYCGLRIGVSREKMNSILIAFLPVYALLTGGTPSVVRAVLMMLVILISIKIGQHRILPLDALCAALLLMLFFSPTLIFDVGFQLSFSACVALLISSVFLLKDQATMNQLLLTSYIAQLATLPIVLFHFFEFSIISIAANLLFVPFFSVLLTPFMFFVFVFHPFIGFLLNPFLWITNQAIILVNEIIQWLSQLPLHMIVLGKPGVGLIMFYLIIILIIFYNLERYPGKGLKSCLLIFLPIVFQAGFTHLSPYGEVTFIDVGQGDCILIKLPFNQGTYLIDAGGMLPFTKEEWQKKSSQFEVGEDIVLPFLKGKGITSLDKLILTHGDYDHMGGAKAIIEGLPIEEIILPRVKTKTDLDLDLIKEAQTRGIPISFVSEGDGWNQNEFEFNVLSPSSESHVTDVNNTSIVIHAEVGGLSWLFTGDVEKERELELTQDYSTIDLDVLKVGHHGSQSSTSEELLKQLQPEIAVISAGEKNRYGHPHQEVLTRLENRHIQILRTDQHGAISYIFKKGRGTFSVMIP